MEEDQERVLEDAKRVVKEQAYFMRKSVEEANLRGALKHAANMLGELRTNLLSPRNYYVLFMQVFDELRGLETAFREEYRRGRKMRDLYENVQHAGFVLPRLYLLITVGSVYIQTRDVSAKSILNDLSEMLKGVQHPIKGLFLRYYYLKMIKDKLPDTGSEYEGDGGDVTDAVHTIVDNLREMNKLWIRVQTQGGKDKAKKERERQDVKVTIGENLVRLSALNGCTLEVYQSTVLDSLIEIITGTKDTISQQYLMDCIIQAFPDEFHLHSLEKLLQTCGHLMQNNVDVKTIFIRLMERLSDFAGEGENVEDIKSKIDIFTLFKTNIDKIIEEQAQIELSKLLELQVAFLKFVSQCYPAHIDYVNQILSSCCALCSRRNTTEVNDEAQKNIVSLLTLPLESLSVTVLSLNDYPNLMKYLPFKKRKIVAYNIAKAVANASLTLKDLGVVNQLIDFLTPILKDDPENQDPDPSEFASEQTLVARIVHLAIHNNPNEQYTMLNRFREVFLQGGDKRIRHTIPALVHAYFKLIEFVHHSQSAETETPYDEATAETGNFKIFTHTLLPYKGEIKFTFLEVFTICRDLIQKLTLLEPSLCLRLNLTLVLTINNFATGQEFDEFTYDICTDTLHIYQDEIADSDAKMMAMTEITASFQRLTCLSEDNFDTLIANTTQYCAKLLKKSEQCLAILKCTHLFYCPAMRNEQRVMECFKKVLKLAEVVNSSQPTNKHVLLYVSILNKFLYFLEQEGFNAIRGDDINFCVQIIKDKSAALSSQADAAQLQTYFKNTLDYIEYKKANSTKFSDTFA